MIPINLLIILFAVIALLFFASADKSFNLQRTKLMKAFLPYGVIVGHISAYNSSVFSVAIVGSFIVGVFFFISAYGLECKRQNGNIAIDGLWSRLLKLFVPLIVPIVVYVVALAIRGDDAFQIIMRNVRDYQFILPFTWFVIILAIFYAFFYVLSSLHHISDKHFLLLLTLSVCVFSAFNFILFRGSAYTNFSSLCFPAGVFYRQYESKIEQFLSRKTSYLLCFLVFLATGFAASINHLLPVSILVWSILVIMFSTLFNVKKNNVLDFFSNISYEVYVCQGITYLFIHQHFDKYPPLQHILLTIALTIAIAVVCHFVTSPIKRLLLSTR